MSNVNTALIENLSPFFLRRDEKVTAALAYEALPKLFPNLVAIWLMNQTSSGLVWDSSSQGHHLTQNGSMSFINVGSLIRTMNLTGAGHLSRSSQASLETTGTLSVMAWTKKDTAGTQHIILAKTPSLSGNTNGSYMFVHGSGDNLNLTIMNGTASTNQTIAAPIGEYFFGAATYVPNTRITVYLGTKDGWFVEENTTSIPASRNAATTTDVTIGGLSGGGSLASGGFGIVTKSVSSASETMFRTFFEYTKAAFF